MATNPRASHDPFEMLRDPDAFLTEAPVTGRRPFGADKTPLPTPAQRQAEAAAAAEAARPKKQTKADYAAKLEKALRDNPEFAELHMDVASRVALGMDSGATYGGGYEPDPDEGSALADLLGEEE